MSSANTNNAKENTPDQEGTSKKQACKTVVIDNDASNKTMPMIQDENRPSDTDVKKTLESLKKLKVRPKTTTSKNSSTTRRNLMSFLGDTLGVITHNLIPNDTDDGNFLSSTTHFESDQDMADSDTQSSSSTEKPLIFLDTQYKLGEQIAAGGQGSIKKALDILFHRIVAIKSLHDCVKSQESVRTSFLNEAEITARLEHPSIVPIYGLYSDETKGLHLAMKLIHGKDLRKRLEAIHDQYSTLSKGQIRIREHKMLRQRLEFFLNVCDAMEYVHSKNIIHRDLKPENIMIGRFNETYIMDWGIAEKCDDEGIVPQQISGTPCYLPPELLNKQPIDKRSDIYLLGLILYEIVFLHKAYPQEKTPDILKAVRQGDYYPLEHDFGIKVDSDLKGIIMKALAFMPEERYQKVGDLSEDLRNYLHDEAVTVSPHPLISASLRAIRRHSQAFVWMMILSIVLLFSVSAGALIHDMNKQMEDEQFETKMTDIYSNGLQTASQINQAFNDLGVNANLLGIETAVRLSECKEADPALKFYDYHAGRGGIPAPPDFSTQDGYDNPVSFSTFVYKTCSDTPAEDVQRMLTAVTPMIPKFNNLINSMKDEMDAAVTNVFIGFDNGLEISYPFSNDYSDDFDPRKRPWYSNTIDSKEITPVWNLPYVGKGSTPQLIITCSVPIKDSNGKSFGVLGLDIMPKNIIDMIERKSHSPMQSVKYIISNESQIYTDSSGQRAPHIENGDAVICKFDKIKLFKQMWAMKNGRLYGNSLKKDIYFFMYIKQLDALYVEQYDFNNLKALQ